jgi:hypothetical protein
VEWGGWPIAQREGQGEGGRWASIEGGAGWGREGGHSGREGLGIGWGMSSIRERGAAVRRKKLGRVGQQGGKCCCGVGRVAYSTEGGAGWGGGEVGWAQLMNI